MRPRCRPALIVAFLCLLSGAAQAQENLLQDGGFEQTPSRWQLLTGAEIIGRDAHSGSKCLLLQGTGQVEAFCGAAGLTPGQFYRVDAWVRTHVVQAGPGGYAAIYMDEVGCSNANLDDHDWERVTSWFKAKDDKPFRIYLIRQSLPQGEVLFDDVSLRPCADPNLAPVTFEDGSTLGVQFYGHPGTIARVVTMPTPQGSEHCLLAAPGSLTYKLPREITTGLVEFSFMINLKGPASFSVGGLRLDFLPLIMNCEDRDGTATRQSLGAFSPGRWYRFRGLINLDTQRYDLEVTDFEDPLYSFTRKGLRFAGRTGKIINLWLNGPPAGGLFDDIYLGPVRR